MFSLVLLPCHVLILSKICQCFVHQVWVPVGLTGALTIMVSLPLHLQGFTVTAVQRHHIEVGCFLHYLTIFKHDVEFCTGHIHDPRVG